MKQLLVPSIILSLFITACQLEKRRYRPGYEITFHDKINKAGKKSPFEAKTPTHINTSEFTNGLEAPPQDRIYADAKLLHIKVPTYEIKSMFHKRRELVATIESQDVSNTNTFKSSSVNITCSPDSSVVVKPKKILNIKALGSFVICLLGFPLIGAVISIYLALRALKEFKNNPGHYKGKIFAIAGLVISFIAILYIIFLIAAFIYYPKFI